MKIAHICHSYPPTVSGAAIAAQNLVVGFARRNHSVLVLTASDQEKPYLEEAIFGRIRIKPWKWAEPVEILQQLIA